jgi:putative transposase
MGNSLDECANRYRNFCLKYTPPKKEARQYHWGSRLLAGMEKPRRGCEYDSPGQMKFGFVNRLCQVSKSPEIQAIAKNFTDAKRAYPTFNTNFLFFFIMACFKFPKKLFYTFFTTETQSLSVKIFISILF